MSVAITEAITTLAGFYDPPFRLKAEESVLLTLEDPDQILQGRLDVLVLKDQFWVVVVESKKNGSVSLGGLTPGISLLNGESRY